MIGEDSLLERVTAAAEERKLSHNSLLAYRRTWLKIIAWAAAEGLVLETLPLERVGEFYEEATRRGALSYLLRLSRGPVGAKCQVYPRIFSTDDPSGP